MLGQQIRFTSLNFLEKLQKNGAIYNLFARLNATPLFGRPGLTGALRQKAIRIANYAFEDAMYRMEVQNLTRARERWDVEAYVNKTISGDMIPIGTGYGLSLLEAFMIHEALHIAMGADEEENQSG